MKKLVAISFIVLLFANCKKNDKTPPVTTLGTGHGVFIVNQGVYGDGNSSVSYFSLDSLLMRNNIYSSANGGTPLGDVAQSMTIAGSNAYIVVNNSQKVQYVNLSTFKVINSISNLSSSPRYLLQVAPNKAYITNEYGPYNISILNTQSNSVISPIPVKAWTEQMAQSGNYVFATSPAGYSVYVINSQTDAFVDSITVGYSPTSICTDKNGMLWVYCVGNSYGMPVINPSLYEINPNAGNPIIVQSFNFSSAFASEGSLCMNSAADSLFFIHQDIYRMSITDGQLPSAPFISSNGGTINFYGLLKVPDGRILGCDAKNYTENGAVDVYSGAGTLINSFNVGAASPSDMVYY